MAEKIERKSYSLVALKKGELGYSLEVHDKLGFMYRVGYNSLKAAREGLKIYGAKSEKVVSKV